MKTEYTQLRVLLKTELTAARQAVVKYKTALRQLDRLAGIESTAVETVTSERRELIRNEFTVLMKGMSK